MIFTSFKKLNFKTIIFLIAQKDNKHTKAQYSRLGELKKTKKYTKTMKTINERKNI